MGLLGEVSALNGVIKGATGLVRELKRPTLSNAQFENLLHEQLKMSANTNSKTTEGPDAATRAARWSATYRGKMDADGDGLLSLEESRLAPEVFLKMDVNRDGKLGAAELQAAALRAQQQG